MKEMCGLSDSTKDLIERAHMQDKEARDRLILDNLGLIGSIVKRFEGRGVDREDLFQVGTIGLIKAVDKFDVNFGVMFSTYAVPMITGEIKRFLRDDGMIKVSRSLKETSYKAYIAREQLEKKLGREPSLGEIAEAIEMAVEDVAAALEASSDVESLHRVIYQGDGSEIELMERLQDEKNEMSRLTDKLAVEELLSYLEGDERTIIYMRYFQEKTQSEVAEMLDISQVQVSRMEKRIIGKMREKVR
jgi:RNA polymerase sporulation-specific sigma factor